MYALMPGQRIVAHREAGGVLHIYVELNCPAEWFAAIDLTDSAAASARVAAEFDGWAPQLTAYEEALCPRSEAAYADARETLEICLGDRAPYSLIDLLSGATGTEREFSST